MFTFIRALINRTTMYRLVLYYLLVLFVVALVASAASVLPFTPVALLWSFLVFSIVAWLANELIAWFFGAITNTESFFITALILVLIVPPVTFSNTIGTFDIALISLFAVVSKFIFTFGKKHIFNPAAVAVVLSSLLLGVSATWWVGGNVYLLPFVVIGGLIVVYKIRRFDVILAFFGIALTTIAFTALNPTYTLFETLLRSSIFFLAFAMLTEPLTMPPTRTLRIVYGGIVGFLFAPAIHFGSFYLTPEIGLIIGNLFSYVVSPKGHHLFTLIARKRLARGIYEFVFRPDRPFHHLSGQYLEWTLSAVPFDSRGNRRFFTISSAPEDKHVTLGVRFYDEPSGFKRTLAGLPMGGVISVNSLGGDFTLPKNKKRKVAFIAGGIGVTPFASMARHMVRTSDARDAVLLYSSKTAEEVAYQGDFSEASRHGLRTVFILSNEKPLLPGVLYGFIDASLIAKEIPDYAERLFYVSGPPQMVNVIKAHLKMLGISRFSIKTDYFPGLA